MKLFLIFILNILLFQNVIFEQCCGAGNPISVSTSDNTIEGKKMKVGLNYRFSFSDTYYEEMHKTTLEFPTALKNSNYNYLNVNIGYGITKRLSASISLGYYINKTETFKSDLFGKLNGSGVGDLDLSISYKAYVHSRKGIELAPYFNVKFPVGKFDCEDNGIKLPISLQPSSGSFRYSGGIYFYTNLPKRFFITSFNIFEYAQRIKSYNFNYKYGNTLFLSADANYKALESLIVGIQASYEYKSRSKRENNQELYGTGYQTISLTPHITFVAKKNTFFSLLIDIPVFHKVEEIQFVNKFALQLKINHNMDLNKKCSTK